MWEMAAGGELDELYNKENRDLKWKSKIKWNVGTSTFAWRFTTLKSISTERTHARIVSPSLIIHTHIGSSSSLARTPLTTIIMAIHVVVVSST